MKTVLITGTTSGIGKAFAEKFASMGNSIILVSRNEEKLKRQQSDLQNHYHTSVKYIACELTQSNAVDLIFEKLNNWQASVDVLVNNAGFNECGLFTNTNVEQEMKMIDLHIRCITQLTKRILPMMKKNNYGRIVNVGSTGSFIPSPSDAVYSATKAYVMSFSNALYGELKRTDIKITLLCPGATETEFAAKANIQDTMLFKYAVMKPERVVEIAYPKLMKGKRLVIPGIYNKLLVFFSRILPVEVTNSLTLFMMR
ncbi:MAG: SDR family oxidoreductase [Clostridia bacterium]|nr:SDR family oxidoreductase [Clostridia bacterium]